MLRVPGEADAGVELDADAVHVHGRVQRVLEALHGGLRRVAVGGGHEHRELVAAEARHQVLAAERLAQPRPDLLEHEVAVVMAECVVDLLEAVEVDQQQPTGPQLASLERAAHGVPEPAAVGQLGQAVVGGLMLGRGRANRLKPRGVDTDQRREQQRVELRAVVQDGVDDGREAEEHRPDREAEREVGTHSAQERRPLVEGGGARDQQQVDDEEAGCGAHHRSEVGPSTAHVQEGNAGREPQHGGGRGQREGVLADVEPDLPPGLTGVQVLSERRGELCRQRGHQSASEQESEREHRRHRHLAVARTARQLEREQLPDHDAGGERDELDRPEGTRVEVRRGEQRSQQRDAAKGHRDAEDMDRGDEFGASWSWYGRPGRSPGRPTAAFRHANFQPAPVTTTSAITDRIASIS